MRKLLVIAVAGVMFSGLTLLADDGKKVTISGDGMCAKCASAGDQDLPERRHRDQGRQEDDLLHRP